LGDYDSALFTRAIAAELGTYCHHGKIRERRKEKTGEKGQGGEALANLDTLRISTEEGEVRGVRPRLRSLGERKVKTKDNVNGEGEDFGCLDERRGRGWGRNMSPQGSGGGIHQGGEDIEWLVEGGEEVYLLGHHRGVRAERLDGKQSR